MLQSIVVAKGMAQTHKQARQFITHKHVKVNGSIISAPRHLTTLEEESNIELNLSMPQKKVISDEEKDLLRKLKHEKPEEKSE